MARIIDSGRGNCAGTSVLRKVFYFCFAKIICLQLHLKIVFKQEDNSFRRRRRRRLRCR